MKQNMKGVIDVVVGMQYGDEGKGASAAMLHRENQYGFSARVGGSQAEHRFTDGTRDFRCRVLPSACCLDPTLLAFLGGGHVIRPDILRDEIARHRFSGWKGIYVDENACISRPDQDRPASQADGYHKKRGGYGMGISSALCRKIRRNPNDKCVAKDLPEEIPSDQVTDVPMSIWAMLADNKNGLVEGSQGAMLSLNHGDYPYVTSQDVGVCSIMGSLGISTEWVRNVYGIVRTIPMRVAGDSGSMLGDTIDFEDIEEQMKISIPEYRKFQTAEDGSPDGRERLTKFCTLSLVSGILQNAPTSIVLTHCDWVTPNELDNIIDQIDAIGQYFLNRRLRVSHMRYGGAVNEYCRNQR